MNDFLTLVGTLLGGGALGGIAGAIAAPLTARQKIKELVFLHQHKLDETYLTNAREHIDSLYIPLTISLSRLADTYAYYAKSKQTFVNSREIRKHLEQTDGELVKRYAPTFEKDLLKVKKAADEFEEACKRHISLMDDFVEQGKDAYMVNQIEDLLRSFTVFLKDAILPPKYYSEIDSKEKYEWVVTSLPNGPAPFETGPSKEKFIKTFVAGDGSTTFEKRFLQDVYKLKSYIKEVTLGKASSNK